MRICTIIINTFTQEGTLTEAFSFDNKEQANEKVNDLILGWKCKGLNAERTRKHTAGTLQKGVDVTNSGNELLAQVVCVVSTLTVKG